jgi:hypothetical protein
MGCLKAVLIVNQSDVGIDLSELINGIKTLVIDPENLPWKVLSHAIAQLTGVYPLDNIPLLIYPSIYADIINMPCEKKYYMWITYTRHSNKFLEYMQQTFKMNYE